MRQNQETEKRPAHKLTPLRDFAVNNSRESKGDGDEIYHHNRNRRDHQRGPLDDVINITINIFVVLRHLLGHKLEGNLDSSHDVKKSLHNNIDMRGSSKYKLELLVTPPLLKPYAGPWDFQDGKANEGEGDGEEVDNECDV
ncbi:hypothetical protein MA16_Dca011750 [Dendrobium catenatum]|uniref:Uncharacterized protein n=1 Tax=Dendrobium catenatum TaxID=906689 RepID=A0A2I0WEF6_9ASPA|nr:hypothetical protein MA16_Dca011750 [Dendrobium catenatum]